MLIYYYKAVNISIKTAKGLVEDGGKKPFNISDKRWCAIVKQINNNHIGRTNCHKSPMD